VAGLGLDPAWPLFALAEDDDRISADDAHFVDIIHTAAGTLGIVSSKINNELIILHRLLIRCSQSFLLLTTFLQGQAPKERSNWSKYKEKFQNLFFFSGWTRRALGLLSERRLAKHLNIVNFSFYDHLRNPTACLYILRMETTWLWPWPCWVLCSRARGPFL